MSIRMMRAYSASPRGEEFFATVHKLHRWLLLPGDANGYGRQITGVVAIGLIVMLISGLVLRWPRRARQRENMAKAKSGTARSRLPSGRCIPSPAPGCCLIYLVMALTGLWYSFDWYKNGAVWLLSRPSVVAAPMQPKSAEIAGVLVPVLLRNRGSDMPVRSTAPGRHSCTNRAAVSQRRN